MRSSVALAALLALSAAQRSQVNTKTDYYKLLKLKRNFKEAELKKAYREAAKKYHPDKNPGDEKAAKKFALVAEANEVFSDPAKRRQYDQVRDGGGVGGEGRAPPRGGGGGGGRGFAFNRGGGGFDPFHRRPPPRREPPKRPTPRPAPIPPDVRRAQKQVGRVASLSQLRRLALNPDTGKATRHLVHAFYASGPCEERLDAELRFPHPFPNDKRWDDHLRFTKTDLAPGTPSFADAKKLAEKLGAAKAVPGSGTAWDAHCPTFVFVRRGSGLRAKDATQHVFAKRTFSAFQDWLNGVMKVKVTFRNLGREEVVIYWHSAVVDGEDWGSVAGRVDPGGESVQTTFPTHVFSLVSARAHAAPLDAKDGDGKRFALPQGIRLATHVVSSEEGVVVSVGAPGGPALDTHVSCRRTSPPGCRYDALKRKCPRACGVPRAPRRRADEDVLFRREL